MSSDALAGAHVVGPGETLAGIAAQHGLTYPEFAYHNNVRDVDFIYIGQLLDLPDGPVVVPKNVRAAYISRGSPNAAARALSTYDPPLGSGYPSLREIESRFHGPASPKEIAFPLTFVPARSEPEARTRGAEIVDEPPGEDFGKFTSAELNEGLASRRSRFVRTNRVGVQGLGLRHKGGLHAVVQACAATLSFSVQARSGAGRYIVHGNAVDAPRSEQEKLIQFVSDVEGRAGYSAFFT